MSDVLENLKNLGFELPDPVPALYNYLPYVVSGKMVFVAGQISMLNGEKITGCVGKDISIEDGKKAAEWCALNILAQIHQAVDGDWSRVKRCVKLGGFVNCPSGFADQSVVINSASDLLVAALGECGKHARFAVGAGSLPANFAVEIDAIFELV